MNGDFDAFFVAVMQNRHDWTIAPQRCHSLGGILIAQRLG